MKRLGLYIHIPFCRSKCFYCDFCSLPRPKEDTVRAYLAALRRDLCRRAPDAAEYTVDSIYFGGGTPTYLSGEALADLLGEIFAHYRISPDAEITAECNPATADYGKLLRMREGGFNRLSIGLQSRHANELRALGRIHTAEQFEEILSDARRAGFANLSADVMSGIPEQTERSWMETLEYLCDLELSHISAYGLILEEGTPLYAQQGALAIPGEETARRMYLDGVEYLARRGYRQYEISNFARPGLESRHNLHYWNVEEFLGFGPAAYSDFCGTRFGNSRDLSAYIDDRPSLESSETPSLSERENEYVMLRLRLADGVSAGAFEERFGKGFEERFGARLNRFLPMGFVRRQGDAYAFTPEGMYVSNAILSEVLEL